MARWIASKSGGLIDGFELEELEVAIEGVIIQRGVEFKDGYSDGKNENV